MKNLWLVITGFLFAMSSVGQTKKSIPAQVKSGTYEYIEHGLKVPVLDNLNVKKVFIPPVKETVKNQLTCGELYLDKFLKEKKLGSLERPTLNFEGRKFWNKEFELSYKHGADDTEIVTIIDRVKKEQLSLKIKSSAIKSRCTLEMGTFNFFIRQKGLPQVFYSFSCLEKKSEIDHLSIYEECDRLKKYGFLDHLKKPTGLEPLAQPVNLDQGIRLTPAQIKAGEIE